MSHFDIERDGVEDTLTLPEGVPLSEVIARLKALHDSETGGDQLVAVDYTTKLSLPDGLVSFQRVMKEKFGFVNLKMNQGFFGPTPPATISVEVAAGVKESFPWGNVAVPGIEGVINLGGVDVGRGFVFRVAGNVKLKHRAKLDELMAEVESGSVSIYRGRAVRVNFPQTPSNIVDFFPTFVFLPREQVQPIFDPGVAALVETALWAPIEHTAACRKAGVKLKRGVLLEGEFGTGKTLVATATAQRCITHGWTFVYVDSVKNLKAAYEFAMWNQPAVVFAEDLDLMMQGDQGRTDEVNAVLNVVDGIESKDIEVVTVLTTNSLGGVTRAMLRPGRVDAVIPVSRPSAATIMRLVREFAGAQLDSDEDLGEVGRRLEGCIPPMVKEVVERSKLAAICRGDLDKITASDIAIAAVGAKEHMALLAEPPKVDDDPMVRAAAELGRHLTAALKELFKPKANGGGLHPSLVATTEAKQ